MYEPMSISVYPIQYYYFQNNEAGRQIFSYNGLSINIFANMKNIEFGKNKNIEWGRRRYSKKIVLHPNIRATAGGYKK